MRIKFKETDNRPTLEFGKDYSISLFGCSFWWEFTFTRKNHLYIREKSVKEIVDGKVYHQTNTTFKVSKRELKRLLKNEDFFQFICEISE